MPSHPFFKEKAPLAPLATPPDIAENLWVKCSRCHELTYIKEFEKNLKVCQKCRYHNRLNWQERLNFLLEPDSFVELNAELTTADPLNFQTASETYVQKIKSTCKKSGINESLVTGVGRLGGRSLAIAVSEFGFLGASMGSVFGEKLVRLIEYAIENRLPLLTVSSSGGARMHEGLLSLMQMAKTTAALVQLGKARLPHIALLVDPCYGGVTASYTMVADAIVAEPGALIGFAGPRVIEQTTRQKLPEGFQTAEFLLDHGMLDFVSERRELPAVLGNLLDLLRAAPPVALPGLLTFQVPPVIFENTPVEEVLDYAS